MITEFENRAAASAAAAARIAAALRERLQRDGRAQFVASGGSTPADCYRDLSQQDLDWSMVRVVPGDERWVDPGHADSNAAMISATLLQNHAAAATLLPMYAQGVDIDARCATLDRAFRHAAQPFACALLGMGTDGHFASLFPDAARLDDGLDPDSRVRCLRVETSASPHPRISLTLAALLESDRLLLLLFGDAKRRVVEEAAGGTTGLPVHALLAQHRVPVEIYWAP